MCGVTTCSEGAVTFPLKVRNKITVGKVWTKYSYTLPLKEVDTSCRCCDLVSINPLHYITPPASESCDPPPLVVPFLHATHVLVTVEDFLACK